VRVVVYSHMLSMYSVLITLPAEMFLHGTSMSWSALSVICFLHVYNGTH
jgi:hypothetical protein